MSLQLRLTNEYQVSAVLRGPFQRASLYISIDLIAAVILSSTFHIVQGRDSPGRESPLAWYPNCNLLSNLLYEIDLFKPPGSILLNDNFLREYSLGLPMGCNRVAYNIFRYN